MGTSLSITVHPSGVDAEYLSVSDAMRQVLDIVDSLTRTEDMEPGKRSIVWRLTEAHTNSPPFTITAEAFPVEPGVIISARAARVSEAFSDGFRQLLVGVCPDWMDSDIAAPLKRSFKRNLNGIGRTDIALVDEAPFSIIPPTAQAAIQALDKFAGEQDDADAATVDIGSLEVEVCGIVRWYDKPALAVTDRLTGTKVNCVLGEGLPERLGPSHKWNEAWDGRRLLVTGRLFFGPSGDLKRIDAEDAEEMPWTNVPLSDLKDIDILQGRSVSEHLRLIRESDVGQDD